MMFKRRQLAKRTVLHGPTRTEILTFMIGNLLRAQLTHCQVGAVMMRLGAQVLVAIVPANTSLLLSEQRLWNEGHRWTILNSE